MAKRPHAQYWGDLACEVVSSSHLETSHHPWSLPHGLQKVTACAVCLQRKPIDCSPAQEAHEILVPSTPETLSPSDSVEQAQRGVGSPDVDVVLQDELIHPLHSLLSPFSHERRDPEDAAVEAVEALQQLLPPRLIHQVLKGPLDDRGVHSHQVRLHAHVLRVLLDRGQIAPVRGSTEQPFAMDARERSDKHEGCLMPKARASDGCAHSPSLLGGGGRMSLCNELERL